jgi:hypothetical protein
VNYGSAWYLGVPGSGKTSLAWKHLRALVEADHDPALIVESVPEARFLGVPLKKTVADVIDALWNERTSARFVGSTASEEELDQLFDAVLGGGRVHLFIDESAFYVNARRGAFAPLPRLLRSYRHSSVTIQATTQHASGDVSQEALACAPTLYVFRTMAPSALEALERRYGIPPETVKALPMPVRESPGGVTVEFLAVGADHGITPGREFVPDT